MASNWAPPMIKERKPRGYWTKERCLEQALLYNSRLDFQKGSFQAYKKSKDRIND